MKTKLFSLIAFVAAIFFSANVAAQTTGSTTFNFTTIQQGTNTGLVFAVWIEDASGNFVSTILRYVGTGTKNHLPVYAVKAGATSVSANTANAVNAVTGTTRKATTAPVAWGPYSAVWNGMTSLGVLAPDGVYTVRIEAAWVSDGVATNTAVTAPLLASYTFTKGPVMAATAPADTTVLKTMSVTWVPTALGLDNVYKEKVGIYPNPSKGILNVDYNEIPVTKIDVVNVLGQVVKSIKVNSANFETSQSIDMSGQANGLYIINVSTAETSSSYKVVLEK